MEDKSSSVDGQEADGRVGTIGEVDRNKEDEEVTDGGKIQLSEDCEMSEELEDETDNMDGEDAIMQDAEEMIPDVLELSSPLNIRMSQEEASRFFDNHSSSPAFKNTASSLESGKERLFKNLEGTKPAMDAPKVSSSPFLGLQTPQTKKTASTSWLQQPSSVAIPSSFPSPEAGTPINSLQASFISQLDRSATPHPRPNQISFFKQFEREESPSERAGRGQILSNKFQELSHGKTERRFTLKAPIGSSAAKKTPRFYSKIGGKTVDVKKDSWFVRSQQWESKAELIRKHFEKKKA